MDLHQLEASVQSAFKRAKDNWLSVGYGSTFGADVTFEHATESAQFCYAELARLNEQICKAQKERGWR